jgi:hypothetical protein
MNHVPRGVWRTGSPGDNLEPTPIGYRQFGPDVRPCTKSRANIPQKSNVFNPVVCTYPKFTRTSLTVASSYNMTTKWTPLLLFSYFCLLVGDLLFGYDTTNFGGLLANSVRRRNLVWDDFQ